MVPKLSGWRGAWPSRLQITFTASSQARKATTLPQRECIRARGAVPLAGREWRVRRSRCVIDGGRHAPYGIKAAWS